MEEFGRAFALFFAEFIPHFLHSLIRRETEQNFDLLGSGKGARIKLPVLLKNVIVNALCFFSDRAGQPIWQLQLRERVIRFLKRMGHADSRLKGMTSIERLLPLRSAAV